MKFFCALAILLASSSVLINGDICEPGYRFDHGHVELEGATHILKCDDEYIALPSSQLLCEGGTLKGEQISCVRKTGNSQQETKTDSLDGNSGKNSTPTKTNETTATDGEGSFSAETYKKATVVTLENAAPQSNQQVPGASTNVSSGLSLPEVYKEVTSSAETEENEELESSTNTNSTPDPETSTDGSSSFSTETYNKLTVGTSENPAPESNQQLTGASTNSNGGHSSSKIKTSDGNAPHTAQLPETSNTTLITQAEEKEKTQNDVPETKKGSTTVTSEKTAPENNRQSPGASTIKAIGHSSSGNNQTTTNTLVKDNHENNEQNVRVFQTSGGTIKTLTTNSTDEYSLSETSNESRNVTSEKAAPESNPQLPGASTNGNSGHSSSKIKTSDGNAPHTAQLPETSNTTLITQAEEKEKTQNDVPETKKGSTTVTSEKTAPENNRQFPQAPTIKASGHSSPGNDKTPTITLVTDNSENNQQNVRVFKTPGRTKKTFEKRTTPSTRIYNQTEKKADVQRTAVNKNIGSSPTETYNSVSPEAPFETTTRRLSEASLPNRSNSSSSWGKYNLALLICAILTLLYK